MHLNTTHIKKRRAAGLCGRAGCQVVSGDEYLCIPHRKLAREYVNTCRARKRAAKLAAKGNP